MRLLLEELNARDVPANLIPGWDGGEQVVYGHFTGNPIHETAVVAQEAGACHVMVLDKDGNTLLNEIVFDPNFRGGGHIYAIDGKLLVVPGVGGGPRVEVFGFNGTRMELEHSFFAPYAESFRGGLQVSSGDVDNDGIPEALFLPDDPQARAHLTAVDMTTFETEASIYVDGPGPAAFEPTGGMVAVPGMKGGGFVVQYGPVVDNYVPTRVWGIDGTDVTYRFGDHS